MNKKSTSNVALVSWLYIPPVAGTWCQIAKFAAGSLHFECFFLVFPPFLQVSP